MTSLSPLKKKNKKEEMEEVLIKLVRDFRSRERIFIARKHKKGPFVTEE